MNLYDVVSRKDRIIESGSVPVDAIELKLPGGGQRAVRLGDGKSGLWLKDVHEVTAFQSFPSSPAWTVHLQPGAEFEVWVEAGAARHRVFASSASEQAVRLVWPIPMPMKYDLRLVATKGDAIISVGPLFNPRARLLPLLKGRGIEVGPGANPSVLPSATCDVSYVERMPMDQWAETYAKGKLDAATAGHWDRYVVDSAHRLDWFADGSIDFIFSSHVIEHLVNPLGVFCNWWQKLAPGGVIAGVIPDARYTFDLRQPLSSVSDFLAQSAADAYEPTEVMYQQWCRYTAPYNTPESLRARDYAIHVNYFSVESFRRLLNVFSAERNIAGIFMESVANGKDFGFLIVKQ